MIPKFITDKTPPPLPHRLRGATQLLYCGWCRRHVHWHHVQSTFRGHSMCKDCAAQRGASGAPTGLTVRDVQDRRGVAHLIPPELRA